MPTEPHHDVRVGDPRPRRPTYRTVRPNDPAPVRVVPRPPRGHVPSPPVAGRVEVRVGYTVIVGRACARGHPEPAVVAGVDPAPPLARPHPRRLGGRSLGVLRALFRQRRQRPLAWRSWRRGRWGRRARRRLGGRGLRLARGRLPRRPLFGGRPVHGRDGGRRERRWGLVDRAASDRRAEHHPYDHPRADVHARSDSTRRAVTNASTPLADGLPRERKTFGMRASSARATFPFRALSTRPPPRILGPSP